MYERPLDNICSRPFLSFFHSGNDKLVFFSIFSAVVDQIRRKQGWKKLTMLVKMLTVKPITISPLVSDNRHPPPFHLAQFRVRHVDLEGQLRHPHGQMQLSRKVQVGEVDDQRLTAVHFFTVDQHLVTPGGHLQRAKEEIRETEQGRGTNCLTACQDCCG